MTRLDRSEWTFILIALALIALSVMIPLIPESVIRADPFAGEYIKGSSIEQAIDDSKKPQKITLPEPSFKDWMVGGVQDSEAPPPSPSPTPPPKISQIQGDPVQAFLLEPRHQTILRKSLADRDSFRVMFRFEVFPKENAGKLEILKDGKRILEIPFEGSADGSHRAGAMIQRPGVYQWRIVTEEYKGDFRSFTLRP
jgi:hypothetical protein